jgi:hypothetical protein
MSRQERGKVIAFPPKFEVGDEVRLVDPGPGRALMCTVVGLATDAEPEAGAVRADGGTGQLYVVNEGNVFAQRYELLCAESELAAWEDES